MEPIKISIDVNVELSEQTKAFLGQLFGGKACGCTKPAEPAKPAPAPAKPVEPAKPAKPAPATAPAPTKPAPAPAPTTSGITIEEIRAELQAKITDHRDEIKAMLTNFGVKNVTTLAQDDYEEFYGFLKALN